MGVIIGTSGWQYAHWKGGFYPRGVPVSGWLGHYVARFASVEINNAFYRLPETSRFETWAATVPEDFRFAVKASRYLTHVRRLREPQEPVHRLLERTAGLGDRLGPILLQLPPTLRADLDALAATLAAFGTNVRVAVEFRHDSWFSPAVRTLLERRGVASCLADVEGKGSPRWRTAEWGYVRFHRGRARPESCYGTAALRSWADQLAALWPEPAEVFVYFNNDAHGCAPRNAAQFATAVRRAGLDPSRTPAVREAPLSAP